MRPAPRASGRVAIERTMGHLMNAPPLAWAAGAAEVGGRTCSLAGGEVAALHGDGRKFGRAPLKARHVRATKSSPASCLRAAASEAQQADNEATRLDLLASLQLASSSSCSSTLAQPCAPSHLSSLGRARSCQGAANCLAPERRLQCNASRPLGE